MTLRQFFIELDWFLSAQVGVDIRRLGFAIRGTPSFLVDWLQFRRTYRGELRWKPCLHDRYEQGGTATGEYFLQDLYVARAIFEAAPRRHVDVGSRVDGFVAHVASFREIEVLDVRPIHARLPGVVFRQADLMSADDVSALGDAYCDSISCLHAIEHFGLGRYGDPIDVTGHERGIANMARLLEGGGTFYLSTPIGRERVEFNANRVFDPVKLVSFAKSCGLDLVALSVVRQDDAVEEQPLNEQALLTLGREPYNLGMFRFLKRGSGA
jgi:hypothetical protein